jgi:hypothetical protein
VTSEAILEYPITIQTYSIGYQQMQRWDGKLPLYSASQRVSATQTRSGTVLR